MRLNGLRLLAGGLLVWVCLGQPARAELWCAGYYAGWTQGDMPASNIDFTVITHVIHFSLIPNADGSLDTNQNVVTPTCTADVVTRAHAANRRALISVGGDGTSFLGAASRNHLPAFVSHLTNFMAMGGYDGIDVDWEPINDSDALLFTNFVTHLRAAMDAFSPHKLLTVAVPTGATPAILSAVQSKFDQINLMTYDFSGAWDGWMTWFNSPLYNEGLTLPAERKIYLPSVDSAVTNFLAAGIAREKLGIGIPFYGDVWQGAAGKSAPGLTQPLQTWTTVPTVTQCAYNDLMSSNFPPSQYHYDTNAESAYYSVTNVHAGNNVFISFDDARACAAKATYARNHGLGGLIIWEISQDHQPNKPDPLLQAIKQSLQAPGVPTLQESGKGDQATNASVEGIRPYRDNTPQ